MDLSTRSILEELTNIARNQNTDLQIESTGNNIIHSVINFINRLHHTYDPDVADDLERRIISSIRSRNTRKFNLGMNKIKEK